MDYPRTKDEVDLFVDEVNSYYKNAILSFKEDNQFYEGELGDFVRVPKGFHKNIPTTGRAIVDEAVDNVEPYDIRIVYPMRGKSEASAIEAQTVSRFLGSVWDWWRTSSSDIDIMRDFIKNLFKHGKACLKIVPDYTLWPMMSDEEIEDLKIKDPKKLEERIEDIKRIRSEHFPLVCRSISPIHIMEDPTVDTRKLWIIEKYEQSSRDIRRRYRKYIPMDDQTWDADTYTVYEIWTATHSDEDGNYHQGKHFIYVNRTVVKEEDNPFHFLPYVVKFAGFGDDSQEGNPEKKATGFFTTQIKSMLTAELRRFTHFDAMMQQLAFPIIFLPDEIEDMNIDVAPGGINFVPMDTMMVTKNIFIKADLPDAEYMQSLGIIRDQIERGTTQRALRGAGVPGTDSAAQLQMVTSQAKLRVEPIKKITEEAVDMGNSIILKFIEEYFEEPLSIWAAEKESVAEYTLRPRMIKGRYRTKTTFMPSEEQIKERKILVASEAMAKAALNPFDAYNIAGFDNALEIIQRNLAFEMMQEPSIRRAMAKRALEEWGFDTLELTLETMQEEMETQKIMMALQQAMMGQPPASGPPTGSPEGGPPGPEGAPPGVTPQATGAPVQGMSMPQDLQLEGGSLNG